jgi:hypothetical protein
MGQSASRRLGKTAVSQAFKERPPVPQAKPLEAQSPPPVSAPAEEQDPRLEHRLFLKNQDKFHIERPPQASAQTYQRVCLIKFLYKLEQGAKLNNSKDNPLLSIVHERKRQEEDLGISTDRGFVPTQGQEQLNQQSPVLTREPFSIFALQSILRDKRSTLNQETQWAELCDRYGVSRQDLATLCKYVNIPEIVQQPSNGEESTGNHQLSLVQDAEWIDNLLEKTSKKSS